MKIATIHHVYPPRVRFNVQIQPSRTCLWMVIIGRQNEQTTGLHSFTRMHSGVPRRPASLSVYKQSSVKPPEATCRI